MLKRYFGLLGLLYFYSIFLVSQESNSSGLSFFGESLGGLVGILIFSVPLPLVVYFLFLIFGKEVNSKKFFYFFLLVCVVVCVIMFIGIIN